MQQKNSQARNAGNLEVVPCKGQVE